MNRKGYNKAKKSHYNINVIKGKKAKELIDCLAEKQPAAAGNITDFHTMKKSVINSSYNAIKYKNALLDYKREKNGYMEDVTGKEAAIYAARDVNVDAVRIWSDMEENELQKAINRFETCAQWLASNGKETMEPAERMLVKLCKTQRTREAVECMEVTGNGRYKKTAHFEDYLQECLLALTEYALNNPNDKFSDALFVSVKKAMYAYWSSRHYRQQETDETGKTVTVVKDKNGVPVLDKDIEDEKGNSATLKEALPDTYAKPLDYNVICEDKFSELMENVKPHETETALLIASGHTQKEAAELQGISAPAVNKQLKAIKKRIVKKKQLAKKIEKEIQSMLQETKEYPRIPEHWTRCSYHKTMQHSFENVRKNRIKQHKFSDRKQVVYNVPNTVKQFENACNRAIVSQYVVDTNKRTKRLYGNNGQHPDVAYKCKLVPDVVQTVKHPEPLTLAGTNDYKPDVKTRKRLQEIAINETGRAAAYNRNKRYCDKLYKGI